MFLCGLIYAFSHYHSHKPFIIPLGVTCSYRPNSGSAAVLGCYQIMGSNPYDILFMVSLLAQAGITVCKLVL